MDVISGYIPVILFWILSAVAFQASWFISLTSRTFRSLPRSHKTEWIMKILSNIHCVVATVGCLYCVLYEPEIKADYVFGRSQLCDLLIDFNVAYWSFELLIILCNMQRMGDLVVMLHHVVAIGWLSISKSQGELSGYACWYVSTEWSTFASNFRWFYTQILRRSLFIWNERNKSSGMTRTDGPLSSHDDLTMLERDSLEIHAGSRDPLFLKQIELAGGIWLWISYVLTRLLSLSYMLVHIIYHWDHFTTSHKRVYVPLLISLAVSLCVSIFWFDKITSGLRRLAKEYFGARQKVKEQMKEKKQP